MRPHLLYADRDFQADDAAAASRPADLVSDLSIDVLLDVMAAGDQHGREFAQAVLLAGLSAPDEVTYRQDVLTDCLRHPDAVAALHRVAASACQDAGRQQAGPPGSAGESLRQSLLMLATLCPALRELGAVAADQAGQFRSAGFSRLTSLLTDQLTDSGLTRVAELLTTLRFRNGIRVTAGLGHSNKGTGYVLQNRSSGQRAGWPAWLPGRARGGREPVAAGRAEELVLDVPERDVSARQALGALRNRALGPVASVLAATCDRLRDFLELLRLETGFYLGCARLHQALTARGVPLCLPEPAALDRHILTAAELRDPVLVLTSGNPGTIAGNDLDATDRSLILITGASQGGKSTLLRSIGLAQLMLQAGLFTCARSFTGSVRGRLATHFARAEDAAMISGKLDEELARLSILTDEITPGCILLCNDSFASTTEREGAHIAHAVTTAFADSGVLVVFATHLHELARCLHDERPAGTLVLRAGRTDDGRRTYRFAAGAPVPASYAADTFREVFGNQTAAIR